MNGLMAFSAVMILCSICNVIGMALNLKPPPAGLWMFCWFATAVLVGFWVSTL